MGKQYDAKVLRKLQLAQCRILEDFIKICKEHNLDYFIFSGCAIGVERHQGFVPWDDDIDIGMLRKDYNKFLKIVKRDYSKRYSILEISEDASFPFFMAEFKRNGTKNIPEIFKSSNIDLGIGVEIYPFDNVADHPGERQRQLLSVFFWHKIKILREFAHPVIRMNGWKKQVVSVICVIAHAILCILHIPHKLINDRYMKSAVKYNHTQTKMISCFFSAMPTETMLKRTELFPLVSKKFEYMKVYVPNKNHEYLTRMYGNYMKLPPKGERNNHFPYVLEFGVFDDMKV